MNDTNLFSIDVDAHLRKAASHTFGSAAHYPVELGGIENHFLLN